MASAKKNEIKPLNPFLAVLLVLGAFALMGVFLTYVLAPPATTDDGTANSAPLVEQSYGEEETSAEPAPPEVSEVKEYMSDADVGDVVRFGEYEQNGNTEDGPEPIEWIVLEKQEDKLLLISRYCLDAVSFNTERGNVWWGDSSLQVWLNEDFMTASFSPEEQGSLVETSFTKDEQSIDPLMQKVFILSAADAVKYYEYDSWRTCSPTAYAVSKGVRVQDGNCWWWLSDSGEIASSASYVYFDGAIRSEGFAVDFGEVGVRPAIYVSADTEREDISETTEMSE